MRDMVLGFFLTLSLIGSVASILTLVTVAAMHINPTVIEVPVPAPVAPTAPPYVPGRYETCTGVMGIRADTYYPCLTET